MNTLAIFRKIRKNFLSMSPMSLCVSNKNLLFFLKATYYILIAGIIISCTTHTSKDQTSIAPIDSIPSELAEINKKIYADPKNPAYYHERAKYYFNKKDIQSAAANMKVVMDLDSSKATYLITLADIYFVQNKTLLAKNTLENAISKEPNNDVALVKLAELYLYVRKYDQSMELLNRALKANKTNAKAYFIKGYVFKEKGDTTKALSSFQTAIEQDQEYYNAYMQMGLLFSARKNPLALQYYNNALNINPKSEEAIYGIGMFFMETGEYNKSIDQFTNLLKLNPKNTDAHFNLGYIHFKYLKVYQQAIKHFNDAINADPNFAKAYYMRGLCYETLGDIARAKADYGKATQIEPQYELANEGLKRVLK